MVSAYRLEEKSGIHSGISCNAWNKSIKYITIFSQHDHSLFIHALTTVKITSTKKPSTYEFASTRLLMQH